VLPYVNLAASLDPSAVSVRPDETASVEASVRNNGTEPAHEVVAHVRVGRNLDFLGASIGPCVPHDLGGLLEYDCPAGSLAPGQAADFVVDFRPKAGLSADEIREGANLGLWVSSREPELVLDQRDNLFNAKITIGESIGDLVLGLFVFPRASVGETIVAGANVRNDGPDTIHDVVVVMRELWGSARPVLTAMTSTSPACRQPLSNGDRICEIAELAPGEHVDLTFSIATGTSGDVFLSIDSEMASSDPNTSNGSPTVLVNVTEPLAPPPTPAPNPSPPASAAPSGGSGGGGALDAVSLSVLGLLLVIACRRATTAVRRGAWGPAARGE
jgi:hypothetical protein